MSDDKVARSILKARFAGKGTGVVEEPSPGDEKSRRSDFKGVRGRLGLRLDKGLIDDLELLAVASRIDKNGFCEKVLRDAVTARLKELEAQFGAEGWEVIKRCAQGPREMD